jgi:hypothetical protein
MRVDRLRYASVTIQVHDNDLYEHLVESEDDKTALSYVEVSAVPDSRSCWCWPKFAYRDDDLQFRVFLDGRLARSYMIRSEKMKEGMTMGSAPTASSPLPRTDRVRTALEEVAR